MGPHLFSVRLLHRCALPPVSLLKGVRELFGISIVSDRNTADWRMDGRATSGHKNGGCRGSLCDDFNKEFGLLIGLE